MNIFKKSLLILKRSVAAILLFILILIIITSISPIYDFQDPKPFQGENIYNPYLNFDTVNCWKKANFHVHTKVNGPLNECKYKPEEVYYKLKKFDYDIITFSNHNKITTHPIDSGLQVNVYEHGYNLFKFHKHVFGSNKVNYFDNLFPFLASQKQFQIDLLSKEADLIQINHPLRTFFFPAKQFNKLDGYHLLELDSGHSTENIYWDNALSSGHYCFGVANDDLHNPDRTNKIAIRCNFLCTPSIKYDDILQTLKEGNFYAMRIPDYGNGDWTIKYQKNKQLPYIKNIGIQNHTIFIQLSQYADSIKFIGQNHNTLLFINNSDTASYIMQDTDPYARIIAYFPQGEVIYSNPFARYDKNQQDSPFIESRHHVNYTLSILFNLMLIVLLLITIYALYKLLSNK